MPVMVPSRPPRSCGLASTGFWSSCRMRNGLPCPRRTSSSRWRRSGCSPDWGAGDSAARLETLRSQGAAYDELSATLTEVRDVRTGEIILAGEGVGRAADAVRFW